MVKVIVPNPQYEGTIADVRFHQGVGHFEDSKLAERVAKQFGFTVEKPAPKEEPKEEIKEEIKPAPKRNKRKAGDK